ncbi:D-lactate dehydrogenase [Ameyamaea chiangmaiensis NBRC 103196]|uniref:FAD-binding oxidoreductase n=1 Tax=Ameyamaea chiangmaiensis TaxID=442969 RepID=UPI001FE4E5AF|nr:FAD-linked oxidase C-terminal domain-containing protein [Ameyamaea chiangmaiensis]GBQ68213.1 D-lactate dehydrogenase [Ameyamaea chiangmaiensis NBRC 103196]
MPETAKPIERLATALAPHFGDRLTANSVVREQHSHGEGWRSPDATLQPELVIFAETTNEVARVLRECSTRGIAVTAFGGGTSLEGQTTPLRGGVSLDLSRMTRVIEMRPEDMTCRVEAGVTRQALNHDLRDMGLFFAVDPGGEATIGGMCATRASGTGAVRYGTIAENVSGLTVVTVDGRVLRTGGSVRKSSTGYDLTHLFIGSEGTLGIITEIQLRLHGIPESVVGATCQFETLSDAIDTAVMVMQSGLPVGRMEFLDEVQMDACIRYSKLDGLRALPSLFFEFHGTPTATREQAETVRAIVDDNRGFDFRWSASEAERLALWKARHAAYFAGTAYRPGWSCMTTDAIVPISRLTELMTGAKADIAASGLVAPILGHVGDGNFHTLILYPPEPGAYERAVALDHQIIARALALGGSASGEHGIGMAKQMFMTREHDANALDVMRAIKAALDPANLLNPGKLLPPAD